MENPPPKRSRPSNNPLVDFHINYLVQLLKDKPDVAQKVLMLKHAVRIFNAGADAKIVKWHVQHIQKDLPDCDSEIMEAADMLVECIKYMDT